MSKEPTSRKITTEDLWSKNTEHFENSVMKKLEVKSLNDQRKKNFFTLTLMAAAIIAALWTTFLINSQSEQEVFNFLYEATLEASEYENDYKIAELNL